MTLDRDRLKYGLRIAITVAAWLALLVYAHSLAHAYEEELAELLASPFAKLIAATLFLTAFVYFAALSLPFLPKPGFRGVAVILLWSALLLLGHSVSHDGFHEIQASLETTQGELGLFWLTIFALIYALALAMPFVPGVEIGLLIIALLGTTGALVAYVATVAGLTFAFAIGRLLPDGVAEPFLSRIGGEPGGAAARSPMDTMLSGRRHERRVLAWLASRLAAYRYVTLAVCLNFPGNSVVGGGGGIALLSGASRGFSWTGFLATVAVATSPIPLLVLTGMLDTRPLLEHHGFLHNLLSALESFVVHE